MEDVLINRLLKLTDEIKNLSENSNLPTDFDDNKAVYEAKVVQIKLETLLQRLENDLNNYFRLVNIPSADDISEISDIQLKAQLTLAELKLKLSIAPESTANTKTHSTPGRLPKLELPQFNGDILTWHPFWDQFSSNIDKRNLSDVDKLLYLRASLTGEAKKILDGLETTNNNYQIALNTLKERYGKQTLLIDSHYSALYKINPSENGIAESRKTLNDIEQHLRILSSLGENINHNHLRFMILEKFPNDIIYELKSKNKSDSIEEIRKELENIISAKEEASRISQSKYSRCIKENKDRDIYTVEALHVAEANRDSRDRLKFKKDFPDNKRNVTSNNRSYENRKRHYNERKDNTEGERSTYKKEERRDTENPKRRRISLSCIFCKGEHYNDKCEKFKTLKERKTALGNRCYKCFRRGHNVFKCSERKKCVHCEAQHNRALCPGMFDDKKEVATFTATHKGGYTVLQTATVNVAKDRDAVKKRKCRVLLDSGSQRSYITQELVKTLNLPIEEEQSLSVFTFGSKSPQVFESPLVKFHIETRTRIERVIYANTVPVISERICIPSPKLCDYDKKLILADDGSSERIDILIGNDYYHSFIAMEKIQLKENLFMVNSEFGWILSGELKADSADQLSVVTYFQTGINMKLNRPDPPIDQGSITFLWELETIGIADSPKIERDEEAISNFNKTTNIIDNRYTVCWPWKLYPPPLENNYGLAYGRLVNLLKRLDLNSDMETYNKTLTDQINKGVIEEVRDPNKHQDHPVHYLPHHGVIQKGKPIRIVYDASCKIKGNKSLNECLYCGPMMLEDLTSLLIRFRKHKVALSADVEKAFLQIALHDKDRDVTRFLWVKDITKPPSKDNILHLRFCRVPFGVISSPFLLNATIRHHLARSDKEEIRKMANDIYVDNLVTGSTSTENALSLYKDAKVSFEEISMNLREWSSNSKDFMQQVPDISKDSIVKVLGLDWNLNKDSLQLRCKFFDTSANTKREILRVIASVYDPCGFVVPYLLRAKLFLQDLWKAKIKWDTKLSKNFIEEWTEIREELEEIKHVLIPRSLLDKTETGNCQLHCFTDASLKAYSAVVYILHGNKLNFITGKSRLVPIKDQQHLKIPRLELLGVVIGSRLIRFVLESLQIEVSQQILWTDSQIVIDWCKSSKLLPPFVARRVEEIKKNPQLTIRYTPTELNPSDVATRPTNAKVDKNVWLSGPKFLLEHPDSWPTDIAQSVPKDICLLAGEGLPNDVNKDDSPGKGNDYLSLEKLDYPPGLDIEAIKKIQNEYFPLEMQGRDTSLKRNLDLFKDIDGILRCKGRLTNTGWPYDKKYPVLIPKDCEFTNQIIRKAHSDNFHVGANQTLSVIRQNFWIPQGKCQVQKIIRSCPRCVKHGGGPFKLPQTPALPAERVNYSTPFTFTGLDYLGPVLVNNGSGTEKRWICLFTCLAVRAIHLEVVQDLTAEEGLLALRRMISTRGKPMLVTSDNAAQFKLISEILTESYCVDKGIKWKFIPQLAPWFGGFYERLVAIVKNCMKRTLGKHLLSHSQLTTIIKEIEAVLNTRPLTSVDNELGHILKPADFLAIGKCVYMDVPKDCLAGTTTKTELIQSWKRGLVVLQEFKDMFVNRYLPSLRERYSHSCKEPRVVSKQEPKLGQIVQIKGDIKNRETWKVGKIVSLEKGADGMYRVAKVKVGNKEFTRSIGHLYPLEMEEDDNEVIEEIENYPHTESVQTSSKLRREAATKALVKIRQWTQNLLALISRGGECRELQ